MKYTFLLLTIWLPWQPAKLCYLLKFQNFMWLVEDYSNNISVKVLPKYLQ